MRSKIGNERNLLQTTDQSGKHQLKNGLANACMVFIAAWVIVAISSCSVGKSYQRPNLEIPQQFNGVSFSDTNSIADIQWRQFFTDTALTNLIDKGVRYNHDMLVAMNRVQIAQQRVLQARVLQLPQLDAQVSAQFNYPSDNSLSGLSTSSFLGSNHIETYLTTIALSWEADVWGRIRRQKEATLADYLQTYEATKAVQTQLVADIAQGFFNLQMLDKQMEISKRNLLFSDSFLVATSLLKDAGVVNMLAVQQAASQKQSVSLLIPQLEQAIKIQENTLEVLTGQLPGEIISRSTLDYTTIPESLVTGLPAAMVSRRPDVRSNEMTLIAANAQVGVAQANMYPVINITAGGGLESFKRSNWFSIPNSLFGLFGGSIAQPIFRKREFKTQFEIAKLQREQAVIEFRKSVLQAVGEVSNALVQVDKLKEQQAIAAGRVDTLRGAVFNAQLLFKSDLANYLEVITAQANALQAELELASIQHQQLAAMVELYRSLGGGWK